MSAIKYLNSRFGAEELKRISDLATEVANTIDGKVPYTFSEIANCGKYDGELFEGWVLKMQTGSQREKGNYAYETVNRTNIIFLCNDGILSICQKEKRQHDVFGGNKVMNDFLSYKEKERIDIDILDPRDMLVEFDFAGKDIDGNDIDLNNPLYDTKGTGILKALRELTDY